jgi:hypothetical protein
VSCAAGPDINENGLVLALDAANTKSILSAVEVLVVAGGGGGGMDMGGGGGGGGVIYSSAVSITPGSAITATVGNGGVGAPAGSTNGQPGGHQYTIPATQGGNSVFGELTAIGGGFGASSYYGYLPNYGYGGTGGSGGGCSGYTHGGERYVDGTNGSTANNTAGQGFVGGNSGNPSSGGDDHYSGGGGGAGGRGTSGPNHIGPNGVRPDGGPGILYPTMSPYYFAGGGGGSAFTNSTGGYGGNGGGGGGALGTTVGGSGLNPGSPGGGGGPNQWANTPGGNAGANTGGGGGGGSHYNANNKGGDGGSGIVIVRYPGSQRATGGTVTSVGGYTIHTFTTSGTFTPNGAPGTGTIWTDFSNNGNSGTLTNGPTYSSANGGSLSFDGVDDYILGTIPSSTFSGAHSIGCWFYRRTVTQWSGLFSTNVGTTSCPILTFIDSTNIIGTNQAGVDAAYVGIDLGANHLNKWIYCVMTVNGSTNGSTVNVYAYKDGSLLTATGSLYWNLSSSSSYYIGRHWTSGSQILDGFIPQVSIHNRALTAAEIQQNYNATRGRYGI